MLIPSTDRFSIWSGVEYDYDFYSCVGECSDDGPCRCAMYDGLRISGVDMDAVLRGLLGMGAEETLDDQARVIGDQFALDQIDSYEIEAEWGIYGQEALIYLVEHEAVIAALRQYAAAQVDAVDTEGVHCYLIGKGFDRSGYTLVDAVKAHLSQENDGRSVSYVDAATEVTIARLDLDKVVIPQPEHYARCEPRAAKAPEGAPKIIGVVVKTGNAYRLVDGYHRMKSIEGQRQGQFIVLT